MSSVNKKVVVGGIAAAAVLAGAYVAVKKGYLGCPFAFLGKRKADTTVGVESKGDDLDTVVQQWLKYDPNPKSRAYIQSLVDAKDTAKLRSLFFPRIAFGTAGLRSAMAPGYKNMNELVILQTTQGLCRYLQSQFPDAATRGVVIGYDGRHNSRTFAELTAAVLTSQNIQVYMFNELVCTPFVPFAVGELGAVAGVMVTASHNPKDDNGYKVYWSNGAQIIPPNDEGIASQIAANLDLWQSYSFTNAVNSGKLNQSFADTVIASYYKKIQSYNYYKQENSESKMPITYTAMHGVGAKWTDLAFKSFSLPSYIPTLEQVKPDPDFPTVAFPNPEEGKGALKLAMEAADRANSSLILANDPDADRLAVACKRSSDNVWVPLTGNEIAAVFAEWVWMNERKRNPDIPANKYVMIASTVSSKHLKAMAAKEGFQFRETLTGFKWIGNEAIKAKEQGLIPLFAFEVEIGFLVGDVSYDKDGVRTAAVFAELANYWARQGQSVLDRVQAFYDKYGHFAMTNSYFFCDATSKLDAVFGAITNNGNYPSSCGEYKIASVRDVRRGYDSAYPGNKLQLPQMTDSYMITFTFANGATATLRNSGTEPKLKFYVECNAATRPEADKLLTSMTQAVIDNFIKPKVYGLEPKKVA